jgi:hypothetical protein
MDKKGFDQNMQKKEVISHFFMKLKGSEENTLRTRWSKKIIVVFFRYNGFLGKVFFGEEGGQRERGTRAG